MVEYTLALAAFGTLLAQQKHNALTISGNKPMRARSAPQSCNSDKG